MHCLSTLLLIRVVTVGRNTKRKLEFGSSLVMTAKKSLIFKHKICFYFCFFSLELTCVVIVLNYHVRWWATWPIIGWPCMKEWTHTLWGKLCGTTSTVFMGYGEWITFVNVEQQGWHLENASEVMTEATVTTCYVHNYTSAKLLMSCCWMFIAGTLPFLRVHIALCCSSYLFVCSETDMMIMTTAAWMCCWSAPWSCLSKPWPATPSRPPRASTTPSGGTSDTLRRYEWALQTPSLQPARKTLLTFYFCPPPPTPVEPFQQVDVHLTFESFSSPFF